MGRPRIDHLLLIMGCLVLTARLIKGGSLHDNGRTGNYCEEVKFSTGSVGVSSEDMKSIRQVLNKLSKYQQPMAKPVIQETFTSNVTGRKIWATAECIGETKQNVDQCLSCFQCAYKDMTGVKMNGMDWSELELKGCKMTYAFWDFVKIWKPKENLYEADMTTRRVNWNSRVLDKSIVPVVEQALDHLANEIPEEGNRTMVTASKGETKVFAMAKCSNLGKTQEEYNVVCDECILTLTSNALYRCGFSTGLNWETKDCHIRYELYDFRRQYN